MNLAAIQRGQFWRACLAAAIWTAVSAFMLGCPTPGPTPGDASPDAEEDSGSEPDAVDLDAQADQGLDATTEDAATAEDVENEAESGEDAVEDPAQEAPEDSGDGAVVPPNCGDGIRDPLNEECDDGLGDKNSLRSCTAFCTVVDHLQETDPIASERRLGTGRHPVAAGDLGHAVVSIEVPEQEAGLSPRLNISTWSPVGEYRGVSHVADVLYDAAPVVAALQDGSFAIAFNSLGVDGDGLGVGLLQVPQDGGPVGTLGQANETTYFGQYSPDIVALGNQIVVGWEDDSPASARTVCFRYFDQQLQPNGSEHCEPETGASRSHIVLANVGGQLARAWREELSGTGSMVLSFHGHTTSFMLADDAGLPPADEAPALIGVDDSSALLVFSDLEGVHMGVVVDQTGATVWGPTALNISSQPRFNPALATTADGIYLAWREPAASPLPDAGWDPLYDELFIQRLTWDGQTKTLDLTGSAPLRLPREPSHQAGDQANPALASTPLGPAGAVLAAWDDHDQQSYPNECKHIDVAIELIPTPIYRETGILR